MQTTIATPTAAPRLLYRIAARTALLALAFLCAGALPDAVFAPSAAYAGQWIQVSCANPDQSPAPSEGWTSYAGGGTGFGSTSRVDPDSDWPDVPRRAHRRRYVVEERGAEKEASARKRLVATVDNYGRAFTPGALHIGGVAVLRRHQRSHLHFWLYAVADSHLSYSRADGCHEAIADRSHSHNY